MPVLNRIAFFQNRRDEVPNQELARDLVARRDGEGIQEIAENLWNTEQNIQSDCLKVLYEVGYLEPGLIADYVGDFLELLKSKNNRMLWGSMIALATVARIRADEIFPHVEKIQQLMEKGTVITKNNGVKILAALAASNEAYHAVIFPYLLKQLEGCRHQDMARYTESVAIDVNATCKDAFVDVVQRRLINLEGSQAVRLRKLLRYLNV